MNPNYDLPLRIPTDYSSPTVIIFEIHGENAFMAGSGLPSDLPGEDW